MELSEIIAQRLSKLKSLKDKRIEPYGAASPERLPISEVLTGFTEGKTCWLCGRVIAKRKHGKAVFCDLKDSTGKIQLYLKEDIIGAENFSIFEDIEVADFISAKGETFITRTQEPSLKVLEFSLLCKAIRPLPEKWHGLKDIELRYRQRYLDFTANEDVVRVFRQRSEIIRLTREFFDKRGYLEVETPMMQLIPGGARGRPFKTYHNEYDLELYLRIAPELYLKKLLVAGLDRVYEINRNFRNEGISPRHNPEFTMLEAYTAYTDYRGVMRITEELIRFLARSLFGKEEINYQDKKIDLSKFEEISFAAVMKDEYGINPDDKLESWVVKLKKKGIEVKGERISRSLVVNLIADLLNPVSDKPVFVTDFFTELCPLAKKKKDDPLLSERFELFLGGLEVANAYSELNDPLEQKKRLQEELKDLPPEELRQLDEDFLIALEHGMPPAGGLGIGIDRLVMIFSNQPSIRDVILFPLLKPHKPQD
ncbi:MAG: lysine--tRNA ligase [Candidatus Omnitrophica bacterium]|nr:lysine--tRNA ligase [Candidatus Omnitrophota bacterium]